METSENKENYISDAVELMNKWYGGDPEWDRMVYEEDIKSKVGQSIYHLRSQAKLSQTKLAEMINTTQAMISKAENGDYSGDYFGILVKVCYVLKQRISILNSSKESEDKVEIKVLIT